MGVYEQELLRGADRDEASIQVQMCGHVLDSLDLDEREWLYPRCGAHHDRDLNAAKSV
jgi:hypothetical protein